MAFDRKNQKIYMVTGKGGVGKSIIAAVVAKQFARQGLKTLLVELGHQSFYEIVYNQPVGYAPSPLEERLDVSLWSGEACLREYVQYLLKVEKLVALFFDNKVMRTFIKAAPALKELAILGKVTSGIRQWGPPLEYDRIVVDGYATGHFMALLKAPLGMGQLITAGPMGEQSRNIHHVLADADKVRYLVVTLMEELPVSETLELCRDLQGWVGQTPSIIANRSFDHDLLNLSEMKERAPDDVRQVLDYLESLAQKSKMGLELLRASKCPVRTAPHIFSAYNKQVIETLADEVNLT